MTPDALTREDRRWMRRALALARRGWGRTWPNPLVGAVLVREGRCVGEGWHAHWGGPHAEAMALEAAGAAARGATCYVTLEPCAHTGKTPPCADALLAAGVARVVLAVDDPNPLAAGGAARLASAGVQVTRGVEGEAAALLNAPFLHVARGAERPFVTLKLARALDGGIAPAQGAQWLTGPLARRWVHRARAQADAVAVGIGTVLADDPLLTVREADPPRVAPTRVVFDRQLRLPLDSRLARSARAIPVLVLVGPEASAERADALTALGVGVERVTTMADGLAVLRRRSIGHVFCEGGATVAGALLAAGTVDALAIFQTSVALGAGAMPAFGGDVIRLADRPATFRVVEHRRLGADLLTVYRPAAS
ncbi:MAG: bifunctional diaminohydroxyphosphoribosylaminopyrimidine deaminase/5-amino-6-(5-phosphoribosylamino)uracil reductase RibD [Gemmatimonadaceae bacterium]|nr:bifunctional diaminohydroxyphosphoribosylaminopyrimidine deaminase/5-amino-6-(5-phosphoribosylamino)uracil reductase RibD [Gemmatimonadaceae bacterium]